VAVGAGRRRAKVAREVGVGKAVTRRSGHTYADGNAAGLDILYRQTFILIYL
jgi:hypothetical protein